MQIITGIKIEFVKDFYYDIIIFGRLYVKILENFEKKFSYFTKCRVVTITQGPFFEYKFHKLVREIEKKKIKFKSGVQIIIMHLQLNPQFIKFQNKLVKALHSRKANINTIMSQTLQLLVNYGPSSYYYHMCS